MNTRMPSLTREYEVSFSDEAEEEVQEIFIEGYKVMFDKKVKTIPVEVVASSKPVIIQNKNGK